MWPVEKAAAGGKHKKAALVSPARLESAQIMGTEPRLKKGVIPGGQERALGVLAGRMEFLASSHGVSKDDC